MIQIYRTYGPIPSHKYLAQSKHPVPKNDKGIIAVKVRHDANNHAQAFFYGWTQLYPLTSPFSLSYSGLK